MSTLSKTALLEKALSKPVTREIKALGGDSVLIKKMSAAQAEDYFFSVQGGEAKPAEGEAAGTVNRKSMRGKLIQACIVDETGAPMFATVDEADGLDNDVVAELFELCQVANGFTKQAADDVKKD
jgi:hypothetical protein